MTDGVVIEPMTNDFILWRCLHGGPLSSLEIDRPPSDSQLPWEEYRTRNIPLLRKFIETYGSCAIIARHKSSVVGMLRFYPKSVCSLNGDGGFCLQQDPPNGPAFNLCNSEFPSLEQIDDKTLMIHCMMTGSPQQEENPYQRKGIATQMGKTLIEWAQGKGWRGIEVEAFEDIPIVYEITGSAGQTFWAKIGFRAIDRCPHPELQKRDPFVDTLEKQAVSLGITPERARDRIIMRYDFPSDSKAKKVLRRKW